jgi:hypothetical protein
VAAYSLVLVLVIAGGGDEDARTVGTPERPQARPMTAAERDISRILAVAPRRLDASDVARFRKPRIRSVTCRDDCRTVEVVYTVGLPGRGRILVDQRAMWERLFSQTAVVRGTMTVTRDAAAAGVPPKREEETPSGAPLLTTRCDRSKSRRVDWSSARGAQILQSICTVDGYDRGRRQRQEPVAPGDETAGDVGAPQSP